MAGVHGRQRRPRAQHSRAEGRRRVPARVRRRAPRGGRPAVDGSASRSRRRVRVPRPLRLGGLPYGVLPGPGRQRADAPPPLRALFRRDDAVMDVEKVDFVSVLTQDIPRARKFYGETLGLPIETESDNDMEFRLGQVTLDVFNPASVDQQFAPSPAGIAIRVPDVAAARADLEAKGVQFDGEIVDTGVCHFAFFKDPDGNALMLHRRYAPFDDGRKP